MATGIAGIGTKLQVSDGASPPVWTTIANVSSISGPSMSSEVYDTTSMDSPNNYRTIIAGLKSPGECSFELWFDPAEATHGEGTNGLQKFFEDRSLQNYRLELPVSPVKRFSFAGFVTNFEVNLPFDGLMSASVTISISGKPTLS